MTTHPHLEGLIPDKRSTPLYGDEPMHSIMDFEQGWNACRDEMLRRLAALPGGGVDDLEADFDTLAEHNVELQSVILDAIKIHRNFNTTADMADWLRDALEAAALPTPNPHEADRNGRGDE